MTMTAQEIYEKVRAGLKAQGCQAFAEGRCWYRAPGTNLKCAVGMLISDEVYAENPHIESWSVFPVAQKLGIKEHTQLLDELQAAHDAGGKPLPIEELLARIDKVAADRGLTLAND